MWLTCCMKDPRIRSVTPMTISTSSEDSHCQKDKWRGSAKYSTRRPWSALRSLLWTLLQLTPVPLSSGTSSCSSLAAFLTSFKATVSSKCTRSDPTDGSWSISTAPQAYLRLSCSVSVQLSSTTIHKYWYSEGMTTLRLRNHREFVTRCQVDPI